MINRYDYKRENIKYDFLYSLLCHIILFFISFLFFLFPKQIMLTGGDQAIKAMMIDLSKISSREQSLTDDSLDASSNNENHNNESKIIEKKQVEPIDILPDHEIKFKPKIDIKSNGMIKINESKDIPQQDPIIEKEFNNTKTTSSQKQVKQEVITNEFSEKTIAPSISNNTQFSQNITPIIKTPPVYPKRALDMRIEGYVIVLFDVNNNGKVENIRIIEAKPNNIFNNSIKSAMKKWQYTSSHKDLTIKFIFNKNGSSFQ